MSDNKALQPPRESDVPLRERARRPGGDDFATPKRGDDNVGRTQ